MASKYIRNYVVKQKNVKIEKSGTIIRYMLNEEHKNHKNTKILCEDNSDNFQDLLVDRLHLNNINYMKNRKGGRKLKDIAKSLTFNVPPAFNISEEDIKKVLDLIKKRMTELFDKFDIDLDESDLFSAVHIQDNSHIHLLLPMLDKQGKNIRMFKEPSFLIQLKILFTESVDMVCKKDIKEYKPLTEEEQAHNEAIRELNIMKNSYILVKSTIPADKAKAVKFIDNEIIKINRALKADKIDNDYLSKLNNQADKVNASKDIKTKISHITLP